METASEARSFQTLLNATVIQADVEADNGVIHVIDRVLIPAA